MKRKILLGQIYFFVVFCLFGHSIVWAQPTITNANVSDVNIILSGTNFGSHEDYNPTEDYLCYIWEDLEDQEAQGDVKDITISDSNNRPGSLYNQVFDGTGQWEYSGFNEKQVFYSYWCRLSDGFGADIGTGSPKQYKTHMLNNWGQDWHAYSAILWGTTVGKQTSGVPRPQCSSVHGSYDNYYSDGVWARHDIWFTVGSGSDECQGEYIYSVDNTVIFDSNNGLYSTDTISGVAMGAYFKGISEYSQQDDTYISFTRARVEIGNNSTWSNCNHREIQIPTAWSDNSITITVNQGSFTDEENVYLFVVDADGIPSAAYGPITIGGSGGADTTPPGDVTAFTAQPGDGQIVLSWVNPTNSDFKGTLISYSTGDDPYPATHNDGTFVCDREANPDSSDNFPVTGLDNGTKYNFSAFTYDEAGNYSETAHVSATPTAAPNVPPTASAGANPTSGTAPLAVTFTGSGTDSDGTLISYSWNFGDGDTSTSQNPAHTYSSEGNYTAALTVTDDDGATGNDSVNISVSSKPDTTPPTISNTGTSDITASSATVTWTTDEPADSVVKYSLTSGTYTDSKSDSEYVTEHSITLTGLSENTTYYFVVNSIDPNGNSAQSSEYSFTTTIGYALDVPLKWNANSEPNLAGYKVYYKTGFSGGPPYNGTGATEGDSPIDVGNVTTYTLHGLSDSDTYFFAITAYDNQGRESEYSNEVTTLSTLRVTSITSSTPNGSYKAGESIDITVNFSEGVTLAGGNLIVALNTGRTIEIEPFTSQTSVSGTYTVQAGDNSSDLDVESLTLSGGTLQNAEGTDCNLSLPTGSNLADNKDIEIDTTPPPDTTDPTITMTSPISGGTYITDQSTITLSGAASDNVGVTSVTWTNSRGGSGTASGTIDWTISAIPLYCGDNNVITITAKDAANNAASATLTVDVKPCPPSGL